MADRETIPLSQFFKDPDVRAAFWRAEQDRNGAGGGLGVAADRPRVLDGGAVVSVERESESA